MTLDKKSIKPLRAQIKGGMDDMTGKWGVELGVGEAWSGLAGNI